MSISTANGKPFAGLALKNITNSLIVAGQVAGATHITNVRDTVVVVSSRQVRMHDCNNVDVYLSCMSRPIIEDCKNIRFAPIPKCYVGPTPNTSYGYLSCLLFCRRIRQMGRSTIIGIRWTTSSGLKPRRAPTGVSSCNRRGCRRQFGPLLFLGSLGWQLRISSRRLVLLNSWKYVIMERLDPIKASIQLCRQGIHSGTYKLHVL